jgi:mannosyltransferase OCH1-like enzyme
LERTKGIQAVSISRIIWSWSDDAERASELTAGLQRANAGWVVRVLTTAELGVYLDLAEIWPGRDEQVDSGAALGILRLALLHEYGGVWLDGAVELLEPLDDWIDTSAAEGFFAFADPAGRPSRALLAAAEGNLLVAGWLLAALERVGTGQALQADWLEQAFADAAARDHAVTRAWDAVARLPLRSAGSELTLGSSTAPALQHVAPAAAAERSLHLRTPLRDVQCAGITVGTKNVGDHVQILALDDILRRQGFSPSVRLDRDRDLAGGEWLDSAPDGLPILINGWLMHRPAAWPPHPKLDATLFGVFFQLASAPHLVEQPALDYYSTRPAVGCRDPFTMNLLRNRGVDAYLSHCASMGISRRLPDPRQTETFVVAPDETLLSALKADPRFMAAIGDDAVAISHYTDTPDFEANTALARDLLTTYRTRARLIVTTMLHCALPAIAMGIPVIVIAPLDLYKHETDVARLSDLGRFVRIFDVSELEQVDWSGYRVNTGALKLTMVDQVRGIVASWGGSEPPAAATSAAPNAELRPQADTQRIPKVFHRIWLGDEMPAEYERFGQGWLDQHPGWELRTWSQRDLAELVNQRYFDGAHNRGEQSDFARYEILLRHGGVYIDAEVECLANIEPLIADVSGFVAWRDSDTLGTAVIGATPAHPFIARLVSELPRSYDNHRREIPGNPLWFAQSARCGAVFVTREYNRARPELDDQTLRVMPPSTFYPRPSEDSTPGGSFARHHSPGSWLPESADAALRVPEQPLSIPRTFHRIWLGGPMPEEVRHWGETWLEHNPGWTMKTWGYEDLCDLVNQSYFDDARNYSEQSDFARYEILLRHGGVYLDTDFECYRNIEPLLEGLDAFLACEDDVLVCGAIVGAAPENPLIRELVRRLPASYDAFPGSEPREQSERCGPRFVSRVYQELQAGPARQDRLHVYPPEYFFPHLWWERERSGEPSPEAYARHYWEASWVPAAGAEEATAERATSDEVNNEDAKPAMSPSRDVVVVLSTDQTPEDWPEVAGVAHLLVGTGTKLTIAAPPAALTAEFIDYLRLMDERLGGMIEIELTDTSQLDGIAELQIPLDEAPDAICDYLQRTGKAWLPVHQRVVAAVPGNHVSEAAVPAAAPAPAHAAAPPAPAAPVRADVPEPERIRELAQLELPDVKRWGAIENYPQGWNPRAHLAADMIDDGVKLLEVGVGAGYLKSITEGRVRYAGVDLAPVIPEVGEFNLESDELPESHYDCIVALGVLEYVHDLRRAVALLAAGSDTLVLSYCFAEPGFGGEDHRLALGWVNGLSEDELFTLFAQHGFSLKARQDYNNGDGWHQVVFRLESGA